MTMSLTRLERLAAAMQAEGMAGVALMPAANLRYLTGLTLHQGKRITLMFVPADGSAPCFVLPALELAQARMTSSIALRFYPWTDAEGPAGAVRSALSDVFGAAPAGPLGIEHTAMRVMELRALEAALPGLATADCTPLLAGLRMVKDAQELAAMAEAARIIDGAMGRIVAQIRAGMTERELSALVTREIMAAGGAGESFANIVAGGPNGANPHHHNTDRPFAPGDLIIIDCGAVYGGYLSDITRTVALGEPGPAARRIYELVRLANEVGRAAVRPGVSGEQIDRATRAVIEDAGYGAQFMHRTGHGLGIEEHEAPFIVAGSTAPLPVGATFTIEPGIYLEGVGGVRIEDDVVVTEDGVRSLTSFPRELMLLPV